MRVVVIDGQGGRIGRTVIERIVERGVECDLAAVGTNSAATTAMLRAGASSGATGENPVVVAARTADVIIAPIGVLAADSLMGEVTEKMATAVGRSDATKLLLPFNMCQNIVVGTQSLALAELIDQAVDLLEALSKEKKESRG